MDRVLILDYPLNKLWYLIDRLTDYAFLKYHFGEIETISEYHFGKIETLTEYYLGKTETLFAGPFTATSLLELYFKSKAKSASVFCVRGIQLTH